MKARTAFIDYYKTIIPDPEKLWAIVDEPLPVCFWANPLKIEPQALDALLKDEGFSLTPSVWHPYAFRSCVSPMRLSKHWGYSVGLWQFQEEVSMLSGFILDAEPGEMVLDLCAAPGNKTAQLSVSMQNQGTLIANDRNFSRLRALGQTIKRLGLMNVGTMVYDGTHMPYTGAVFDKVLVDAPCSCEGTLRKNPNKSVVPYREKSLRQSVTQLALLKKAFQVCRLRGRILYSTCTFAPEENERVLHQLLLAYPGQVRVLPIELPQFRWCPGVTKWQGEDFHPSVRHAMRVWPHLNNTGGFFLALLEKIGSDSTDREVARRSISSDIKAQPYVDQLVERFGFDPAIWNNCAFTMDTQRGVYVTPDDYHAPPELNCDASGLFAIKTKRDHLKITTAAAMLWGVHATCHVVELDAVQRDDYVHRRMCSLTEAQDEHCERTGYVVVTYQGYALGTALYLSPQGDEPARLKSLFPKSLV